MYTAVAFAPDGRTLATGVDSTIKIWDLTPAPASAPQAKSDKELIQGTWKAISAEVFGQPVDPQFSAMLKPTLTFTAEKVTWNANPSASFAKLLEGIGDKGPFPKDLATLLADGLEGVYHLDSTKTPKNIDLVTLGPIKKTMLGIYNLEGDTLRICVMHDPARVDERPTTFATKAGVLLGMVTLKRALGAELLDAPRGTFTIKGGDGAVWALTLDGVSKFKIIRNGQIGVEGSYKIAKDEIEFTDEAGLMAEKGNAKTGIYRWRLAGSKLIFTVVNDQARGRVVTLMNGAWEGKKE